jgi:hypothetical protein
MANRARFWVRIVCSNKRCGQEGDAEWAENEKPSHARDRALVAISDGFSCKMGDARPDPDMICDTRQAATYVSQSDLDTAPIRPPSIRASAAYISSDSTFGLRMAGEAGQYDLHEVVVAGDPVRPVPAAHSF